MVCGHLLQRWKGRNKHEKNLLIAPSLSATTSHQKCPTRRATSQGRNQRLGKGVHSVHKLTNWRGIMHISRMHVSYFSKHSRRNTARSNFETSYMKVYSRACVCSRPWRAHAHELPTFPFSSNGYPILWFQLFPSPHPHSLSTSPLPSSL